jgi:hypothetical protein
MEYMETVHYFMEIIKIITSCLNTQNEGQYNTSVTQGRMKMTMSILTSDCIKINVA